MFASNKTTEIRFSRACGHQSPGTEPAPDRKPSPEHQPISRWGQSGQLAVEPSDELFDDDHHDDDDDQPNDPMEYPVELYEVTERQ